MKRLEDKIKLKYVIDFVTKNVSHKARHLYGGVSHLLPEDQFNEIYEAVTGPKIGTQLTLRFRKCLEVRAAMRARERWGDF